MSTAACRLKTGLESLLSAWEKEPGDSQADTINAVTRAAHEEDWSLTVRRESIRLPSWSTPVGEERGEKPSTSMACFQLSYTSCVY